MSLRGPDERFARQCTVRILRSLFNGAVRADIVAENLRRLGRGRAEWGARVLYYINVFTTLSSVTLLVFVLVILRKLVRHDQICEAAALREKRISRNNEIERAA